MSKHIPELRKYEHEELMKEYNELMVNIKSHLYGDYPLQCEHPKPSVEELDLIQNKIFTILKKDSKPMRIHNCRHFPIFFPLPDNPV